MRTTTDVPHGHLKLGSASGGRVGDRAEGHPGEGLCMFDQRIRTWGNLVDLVVDKHMYLETVDFDQALNSGKRHC